MEDQELRKFLKVLYKEVDALKKQADSNTQRLTALETAVHSALTRAPQAFEESLAATRDHTLRLASQTKKVSEIESILQILSQPPE
jgi:hypothetical protein